jgi:quinol monooxygenase YgiN
VLTVIAYLKAKPGKADELQAALQMLLVPTRREPGCLEYTLHVDTDDDSLFCFYERWSGPDEHAANLKTPHLQAFIERIPKLVDGGIDARLLRQVN